MIKASEMAKAYRYTLIYIAIMVTMVFILELVVVT